MKNSSNERKNFTVGLPEFEVSIDFTCANPYCMFGKKDTWVGPSKLQNWAKRKIAERKMYCARCLKADRDYRKNFS